MKKLLLILLYLPMIGFGQDDKIIFSSGDTIYGKVIEVSVNDITYQHKNETTNNVIKKKELAKVIYSSARIETFEGLSILESKIKKEENEKLYIQQKKEQNKIRIQKKQDRINYFRELNESTAKNNICIKVGISMADIRDGDDWRTFKQDNRLGLSVALDGIFSITDRIDLDASIKLSQKYIKTESITLTDATGVLIANVSNLNRINFIDISPKLRYKIIKSTCILFGPYIGYALNGKRELIISGNTSIPEWEGYDSYLDFNNTNFFYNVESGYENKINRLDYGLNIGISYNLAKNILVSSEYSLGLSNLYIVNDILKNRDYSQKTSIFYLTMGYIFN